ncbi:alpha/beta fold hydrolase [Deinococcus psychrotolerans]|uniref:Alpha/beta fold hydrolase n=1 Tax=Deinococcus psychrotolerans TaxID=2489213 RepID=A0A3G8Y9I3_9DEIO|nr:alpha/beta fold hydrolase [Deinococcus psychrotolerans]AZI41600.1 alpha/beta fold hydrolase [Deinococcus psychrotolerans]
MRRIIQLGLVLLLGGAGYIALTQPERLAPGLTEWASAPEPPQILERQSPEKQTPKTQTPSVIQVSPLGQITDAAIRHAVAQQPISIPALRARSYPGSAFKVLQNLKSGRNYSRQVVSYQSDGLSIHALLTVPRGMPPKGGWPAIVFNHGYIPPEKYRTTERYVAYQDAFASAGFVTLKSDYRGHGDSGGEALGGYNDAGYTVDVLNAAASLKKDARVNAARLGIWGHSMGGQLSLRAILVDPDIKAASLWAGVVASYDILMTQWRPPSGQPNVEEVPKLDSLNQRFLRALSPNAFLQDLKGRPIELQQGTADEEVPYSFQQDFAADLRAAQQPFTAYKYEGDNHNLSRNLGTALKRSVAFFKANL